MTQIGAALREILMHKVQGGLTLEFKTVDLGGGEILTLENERITRCASAPDAGQELDLVLIVIVEAREAPGALP